MKDHRAKIKTIDDAQTEISLLKKEGKRIVFTNGCFDILHIGHARYLYEARALGDYLIVAINSDRSVRALKGPERPVVNENERTEMIAALGCVDMALIFDKETPYEVIRKIVPHVLVKGGDWKEGDIVGADIVKAAGGEVRSITFTKGSSTTDIISRIR
ncbi:MAG: D-glycero-beta-D-manno-heptose 1-phosphate adenylyltransferase [Deltaproteobacteria bacterium]|jgi:D-beta-D-heptose 7-phosphate kinase/D-beta-D-heptose 1-phosphate adenosyltransferase|nr:D-glycero-beta-D-manno-heptose 1-phosphate adenylyltransferase [Deltaproteobacteria bacterium]